MTQLPTAQTTKAVIYLAGNANTTSTQSINTGVINNVGIIQQPTAAISDFELIGWLEQHILTHVVDAKLESHPRDKSNLFKYGCVHCCTNFCGLLFKVFCTSDCKPSITFDGNNIKSIREYFNTSAITSINMLPILNLITDNAFQNQQDITKFEITFQKSGCYACIAKYNAVIHVIGYPDKVINLSFKDMHFEYHLQQGVDARNDRICRIIYDPQPASSQIQSLCKLNLGDNGFKIFTYATGMSKITKV